MLFADVLVLMRGGGDLATGTAIRLVRAGFPVVITELAQPLTVRRGVAFSSAVLRGAVEVEGVRAQLVKGFGRAREPAAKALVPVVIDPAGDCLAVLKPQVVVDARMAKLNLDTHRHDAPFVVGLGPGFQAGTDCHAVVETNRGHSLGRVYWSGGAEADTATPYELQGHGIERVLRAPSSGTVRTRIEIGEAVVLNQVVATVEGVSVVAPFSGILRGLIADGTAVPANLKIGDIDPRGCRQYCFAVSDKAWAVAGGVMEAVLSWLNRRDVQDPRMTGTHLP